MRGGRICSLPGIRALRAACVLFASLLLTACAVHEFPDTPELMPVTLHLRFHTGMPCAEYEAGDGQAQLVSRSGVNRGRMRYVVRFCERAGSAGEAVRAVYREFVFVSYVADTYDLDFTVMVDPGDYDVLVWADFLEAADGGSFYDATDFSDIRLQGPHTGNTDFRDAFRGEARVGEAAASGEHPSAPVVIDMERPMAKYEFVSTDLREFMGRELAGISARAAGAAGTGGAAGAEAVRTPVDLGSYRVRFYYEGYMPNAYNMYTDKPVDSATGVSFEGRLEVLSEDEVSLGFDYVMVNHKQTSISVRIGLFDAGGQLLSLTPPIDVPLQRSTHTVMRGKFLMEKAGGNVGIDPAYDGEYNILL